MHNKTTRTILTILLTIFILLSTTTCLSGWNYSQYRDPVQETCDPRNPNPQMIRIPVVQNGWQIVQRCDLANPKDVAFAIVIFENAWEQTFGRSSYLIQSLNNIMVEWSTKEKRITGYNVNGTKYVNAPITGLTRTPSWIWIKKAPGEKICNTSFVHELVHVAIWSENGSHGDADHEGPKWWGWTFEHTQFIKNVNRTLCAVGL